MTADRNPFAPPTADAIAAAGGGIPPFHPAAGRGISAARLIGIVLFLRVVSLVLFYIYVTRMEGLLSAQESSHTMDLYLVRSLALVVAIGRLTTVLMALLASGVTLFWIQSAHRNLPALGNPQLKYSPDWCVAYWLIPIVNFFLPYLAMCELMNGSDPKRYNAEPARLPQQSASLLLTVWWASFLLMLLTSTVWIQSNDGMTTLRDSLIIDLVATASILLSGALTIAIIRRVSRFQERRYELVMEAREANRGVDDEAE